MNYLPSNLSFKDGVAHIGDTSLLDVAKEYGTPLYVYDWKHLKDNIDYFSEAFGSHTLFRYAAKAFICKALVKELHDKGWGVDVVSGGEMATAQAVTGSLENTLFNGTYKSREEIDFFMKHEGGHISIDNRYEIPMLEAAASKLGRQQPVIMRINLDVGAETHPMVLTTGYDQQFGISIGFAEEALKQIYDAPSLLFSGIHVHIGSQIKDPERYQKAMSECAEFLYKHRAAIQAEVVFDAGGGFFSPYAGDEADHELKVYADAINAGITEHWQDDYRVMIEPGRALVNNPGVILYTAGALKDDRGEKPYILVDGGMSDNPRPALYGSEHKLFNISGGKNGEDTVHAVSGRHCESGDLLVKEALLPSDTQSGDILMSTSTGAYTFAMASNYNRVPKSGVVAVTESGVVELVNRQSYQDTFINDI
ncbi:diaminopimelate decarboxylase [Acidimicrobiaceae bacterium]|nr:diaminopimelate decarboxylase [Acidimicrobiaceae bacterium]